MFTPTSHIGALIVSLFFSVIGHAQIVSSTCTYDQTFTNTYTDGSWNTAYDYLVETDSVSTAMHDEISQSLHDTIMACIAAVYNSNLAARDTVVNQLQIKQFQPIDLMRFELKFDTSHGWTNQFLAGNLNNTSNSFVNDLANLYGFVLEDAQYMPAWVLTHNATARIRTNRPFNTEFIARSMLQQSGVVFANAVTPSGDGSQIVYANTPSYNTVTFRYGWGDCPAGCINKRDWLFRVYPDCSVEFVASYGSLLTGTIDLIASRGVEIFPTIADQELQIKLNDTNASGSYQFAILNAQGQTVLSGVQDLVAQQTKTVSLTTLAQGTYYIRLANANYAASQKLVVIR
jgi:hypothetical protein